MNYELNIVPLQPKLERCQSGRMDRTRNAAYSYGYPGFESQSLRIT